MLRLALKGVLDGQVQRALLQWRTACGGVGACRFKAGQVLQEDAPGIFDSEWARNGASKSFETVSEEESQEVTESATDRYVLFIFQFYLPSGVFFHCEVRFWRQHLNSFFVFA